MEQKRIQIHIERDVTPEQYVELQKLLQEWSKPYPENVQVATVLPINLTRENTGVSGLWMDTIYIQMSPHEAVLFSMTQGQREKFAKDMMLRRARHWLMSQEGYDANAEGFTWNDFVKALPLPHIGIIKNKELFSKRRFFPELNLSVAHDEQIIPTTVVAKL